MGTETGSTWNRGICGLPGAFVAGCLARGWRRDGHCACDTSGLGGCFGGFRVWGGDVGRDFGDGGLGWGLEEVGSGMGTGGSCECFWLWVCLMVLSGFMCFEGLEDIQSLEMMELTKTRGRKSHDEDCDVRLLE